MESAANSYYLFYQVQPVPIPSRNTSQGNRVPSDQVHPGSIHQNRRSVFASPNSSP